VDLAQRGALRKLRGVGEVTREVISEALGEIPDTGELEEMPHPCPGGEQSAALRGDCHVHSDYRTAAAPSGDTKPPVISGTNTSS
jgi:hypothetical protein